MNDLKNVVLAMASLFCGWVGVITLFWIYI